MPITKQELRKKLRERRDAIPHEEVHEKSASIAEHIAASVAFQNADLLLLYAPIGSELNLLPLVRIARANHIPVAFPISQCDTCTLDFRILTPEARLLPGAYGIPEPPTDAPSATFTERTLCILPGLAFTPSGARIGYGKGYYDRFLATFPGVAVGASLEAMLCKHLPTDEHDLPVSAVFTERGMLTCHATPPQNVPDKSLPVLQKVKNMLLSHQRSQQAITLTGDAPTPRPLHLPPALVLCTYLLLIVAQFIDTALLDRGSEAVGAILLQLFVFVVPAILYSALRGEHFVKKIRLVTPRPEHIWFCFCILIVMITGSLLTAILTGGIASLTGGFTLYNTFTAQNSGDFLGTVALILTYAIVPAFCEELIFRSYLSAEYEQYGVGVSITVCALFFAMLHFSFPLFLTYFFLGAILTAVLYATRSFFPVLILHVLYNLFCLFGQPYLSAFYVRAGSTELFLFCVITLFLLFSAFAAGEARKMYHRYARAGLSSDYTVPRPLRALPRTLACVLASPVTAVCIALWIVMSILNL